MEKVISTLWGVTIAIVASGVLFIGANKWFDLARRSWSWFSVLTGVITSTVFAGILAGNRVSIWQFGGEEGPSAWLYVLIAGVAGGAFGYVLSGTSGRRARILVGGLGGLAVGALHGVFLAEAAYPAVQSIPMVAWPLGGAVVGLAVGRLRSRGLRPMIDFATLGWIIAIWMIPDIGPGTRAEAIAGLAVIGLGLGLRVAVTGAASSNRREAISVKSRAVVFLAPAMVFVGGWLVVPTIRTLYLSFLDKRSVEGVGFANYTSIFTDPTIFKLDDWRLIFSNRFFIVGGTLVVLAFVFARVSGRKSGYILQWSPSNGGALALGIFAALFGVFAVLRGTIFNNLWWVVGVVGLATSLGLAIAVLADRTKRENLAKSLIFMPMAISFVGASIIWRFMYIARPIQKDQTGVLNAPWVWLGRVSTEGGVGRLILSAFIIALILFLAYVAYRGLAAGQNSLAVGSGLSALVPIWFLWRLFDGSGIGGVVETESGEFMSETLLFLTTSPYNNFWLMLVLIWIQTGFAMVILSAAIKAVPAELTEASKVDGATESQTFWRITIPQISSTIGVVVTTLIVLVMKVFDIVKVMTNGNFDTQVLANEMWQRAFTESDFGLGSAVAVVLFVSVLPIMYINIRRMQREAA